MIVPSNVLKIHMPCIVVRLQKRVRQIERFLVWVVDAGYSEVRASDMNL